MIVLSHRGYWQKADEKNGRIAFERTFNLQFGTETDVRDANRELVISHDIPTGSELRLTDVLHLLAGRDLPLALNIKADGLGKMLQALMPKTLSRWFTFDMSVPEMVFQLRVGIPVFTRASEYERDPVCYGEAIGVWLDAFDSEWYDEEDVSSFLFDGKQVCIVSSELHRREPAPLWTMLRRSRLKDHPNLMICTDRPEEAAAYFGSVS